MRRGFGSSSSVQGERKGGTDRVDEMKVGLREASRLEGMDGPIYRV
jgi:hypothetical protein